LYFTDSHTTVTRSCRCLCAFSCAASIPCGWCNCVLNDKKLADLFAKRVSLGLESQKDQKRKSRNGEQIMIRRLIMWKEWLRRGWKIAKKRIRFVVECVAALRLTIQSVTLVPSLQASNLKETKSEGGSSSQEEEMGFFLEKAVRKILKKVGHQGLLQVFCDLIRDCASTLLLTKRKEKENSLNLHENRVMPCAWIQGRQTRKRFKSCQAQIEIRHGARRK
jgi:hypothetical protein